MYIGKQKQLLPATLALSALLLGACATDPATHSSASASASAPAIAATPASTPTVAKASTPAMYFAVLPEDERFYLFGDAKNYFAYKAHGEVALTRSRIGASPKQTTVVFGLTNDEVKGTTPSAAEMMFDGKAAVTEPFYGEVFKDGRYYVFNEFADMKVYLESGEAAYTITEIGTGPNGATQVWVLNKDSIKKGRPTQTIAMFSSIRTNK